MMDGEDEGQDLLADGPGTREKSETVDLSTDSSLVVDISDALSERDKVKFTVHTKTSLPEFRESEFAVVRQHEEFIWLHDRFEENEEYAGIVIPPAPPRPEFDASREKLQKLGEGEGSMTKDEFQKMKQELEAEYLATFKKTVAMHEVFLQRLAGHPLLRMDVNFKVFLEYNQELSVRGKNNKEKFSGFLKSVTQSVDEVLLSNQRDKDDYFEHQKTFLVEYFTRIKDATMKADKMTKSHKNVADCYIKISACLSSLASAETSSELNRLLNKVAESLEKERKLEGRVASDEDLKLSDTLRYYMRDTAAAKNLLYRRLRALSNYEAAEKTLDKARAKNKDVQQAQDAHHQLGEKFEKISETAKQELADLKSRRITHFKKNLVDLAEFELKHARAQVQLLGNAIAALKELS